MPKLAVVGVTRPPAEKKSMNNDELTAAAAELRARLRSAEHRIADLEEEAKELREQRAKFLVGIAMLLGSAVTGLAVYIFKTKHPF